MALAGINLIVTPGLGTIMAGRFFAGVIQLAAAATGFLLLVKWFFTLIQSALSGAVSAPSWQWQSGAALFIIGWLGAAWSSLNFVRAASLQTPPKLDGSPG